MLKGVIIETARPAQARTDSPSSPTRVGAGTSRKA
jgi:hypothetical protein